MIEERPIPSCPGYAATSDGRIISLARTLSDGRRWKRYELKPRKCSLGYETVIIWCGGKNAQKSVHRLVCEAFHGPCPLGMVCCHNNGDRKDNRPGNLRWDTHKANHADAIRHGTHQGLHNKGKCPPNRIGSRNAMAKLRELDVRWIRYLKRAGVRTKDLSDVYGVSFTTIQDVVRRRTWRHVPEAT